MESSDDGGLERVGVLAQRRRDGERPPQDECHRVGQIVRQSEVAKYGPKAAS